MRSMPSTNEWDSTVTNLMMRNATELTREKVSQALIEKKRQLDNVAKKETDGDVEARFC